LNEKSQSQPQRVRRTSPSLLERLDATSPLSIQSVSRAAGMDFVHELRLCVFGAGCLPRRVPAGLLLMHDYFEPPTYWDNFKGRFDHYFLSTLRCVVTVVQPCPPCVKSR
jgi:hypothetical protein